MTGAECVVSIEKFTTLIYDTYSKRSNFLCNVRKLWVVKIFRILLREEKIKEIEILRFFRKFYIFSQHVVVNQNSNRHFFRIEIKKLQVLASS